MQSLYATRFVASDPLGVWENVQDRAVSDVIPVPLGRRSYVPLTLVLWRKKAKIKDPFFPKGGVKKEDKNIALKNLPLRYRFDSPSCRFPKHLIARIVQQPIEGRDLIKRWVRAVSFEDLVSTGTADGSQDWSEQLLSLDEDILVPVVGDRCRWLLRLNAQQDAVNHGTRYDHHRHTNRDCSAPCFFCVLIPCLYFFVSILHDFPS